MFLNQATQVNAWDRMMVNNGEKIVSLNEAVEKVKLDQQVCTPCFIALNRNVMFCYMYMIQAVISA